ncbi:hypothetical protein GCM10010198_02720 [Nocardia seriolae]|nr:hypothetical protein NSERKGN1266_22390 [Nocardia seriolae]BEK97707.1 hypothetical protein NSER024013_56130 [Nocardia seriolae]GEM22823.1 hypothetical protein NS2_10620 [Nocardia seriolae NBRC 15557]
MSAHQNPARHPATLSCRSNPYSIPLARNRRVTVRSVARAKYQVRDRNPPGSATSIRASSIPSIDREKFGPAARAGRRDRPTTAATDPASTSLIDLASIACRGTSIIGSPSASGASTRPTEIPWNVPGFTPSRGPSAGAAHAGEL